MEIKEEKPLNRYHYFDGLRGIAALMVVYSHLILLFFSDYESKCSQIILSKFDSHLALNTIQPFINVLGNGGLAVFIFWFMSGYVISINLFKLKTNDYLISAITKRYFRLALPAAGSVLLAYGLLKTGAIGVLNHAITGGEEKWLQLLYGFEPHFLTSIKFSFWDTFFNYQEIGSYNASLWTMNQELYGSFLCFFLFGVFRSNAFRYWVYGIIVIILFFQNHFPLVTFLLGFILCDVDHHENRLHQIVKYLEEKVFSKWYLSITILLILFYFAGKKFHVDIRDMFFCCLIVFAISRSMFIKTFLSNKFFKWLGKITFSLYLVHLPILTSLSPYVYQLLHFGHIANVFLASLISLLALLLLAQLFYSLIDLPSIKLSNKIGNVFVKNKI